VLETFSSVNPPSESSVWTLDALFLIPKERLKYYRKLYARLLKSTAPGRSDHKLLLGAMDKLDHLLATVDGRGHVQVGLPNPPVPRIETEDEVVINMSTLAKVDERPPQIEHVPVKHILEQPKKEGDRSELGRRQSTRVAGYFKPRAPSVSTLAKMDEHPPRIDELAPVVPLENPASDARPKKSNPLIDLLETERTYVDLLTGIIRVSARSHLPSVLSEFHFCNVQKVAAAWSRSNLPPPELDTMFRSIEGIYRANRSLLTVKAPSIRLFIRASECAL
jgi:hypothetical protein